MDLEKRIEKLEEEITYLYRRGDRQLKLQHRFDVLMIILILINSLTLIIRILKQ